MLKPGTSSVDVLPESNNADHAEEGQGDVYSCVSNITVS